MRINKYLSACELGSRRKVEELIVSGRVKVNGVVVSNLATDIESSDKVTLDDKLLKVQENKVYIMLNKPKCYITSLKDEKDRRLVTDLLKNVKEKVFPVGRLDYNTEGLLLLTNDGDWANNIIHPSKHIGKTYEVKIKYLLTQKQINSIKKGIVIEGRRTLPAKVEIIGNDENYHIVHIRIYEGRNREVRKIFESLNLKIYSLKRISIGALELGDLKVGEYRSLKDNEKTLVFMGD